MAEQLKTYESTQKGLVFHVQMTESAAQKLGLQEVKQEAKEEKATRRKPAVKTKESE